MEISQSTNYISPARFITEAELSAIGLRRHTQGVVVKTIGDADDYDNGNGPKRRKPIWDTEGDK